MTLTDTSLDRAERLEAKLDLLTGQVEALTAELENRRGPGPELEELVADLVPLGPEALALVIERLAEAEEKGYFQFARAGADVADRIVSGFDADDLAQLGENVVTILETVKEITQPEMLALLGHMVEAVQRQQRSVALESGDAPSLWALLRQVRDADVRRGISRALATLGAVSVETGPPSSAPDHNPTPRGES